MWLYIKWINIDALDGSKREQKSHHEQMSYKTQSSIKFDKQKNNNKRDCGLTCV